jgi:hypothetical protein
MFVSARHLADIFLMQQGRLLYHILPMDPGGEMFSACRRVVPFWLRTSLAGDDREMSRSAMVDGKLLSVL